MFYWLTYLSKSKQSFQCVISSCCVHDVRTWSGRIQDQLDLVWLFRWHVLQLFWMNELGLFDNLTEWGLKLGNFNIKITCFASDLKISSICCLSMFAMGWRREWLHKLALGHSFWSPNLNGERSKTILHRFKACQDQRFSTSYIKWIRFIWRFFWPI